MSRQTFRVATLNISNNAISLHHRYKLLFEKLEPISPDFILLQEVLEPKTMEKLLKHHGFEWVTMSESHSHLHRGDCLMIGSRIKHTALQETHSFGPNQRGALYVTTQVNGHRFVIVTSHLAWGSYSEGIRLKQAEEINSEALRLTEIEGYDRVILGGDLNADENSRTVRYLQGMDLASDSMSSTYWTDAYISGGGIPEQWATSDQGVSSMGRAAAYQFGTEHPEMLPKRRIDYIFSQGWCYGKLGCPISFGQFGSPSAKDNLELSDHLGIYTDILA